MTVKYKKTLTLLFIIAVAVATTALFVLYNYGKEEIRDIRTEGIDTDSPAHVETLAENKRLDSEGEILLGVVILLDEGWKTYWREVWESGLPPVLDWSESTNLKSTQVFWPAPERFDDPGGSYLGYQDALALPIVLKAIDSTLPLEAKLWLRYAVCREICIPLEERLTWHIAPVNGNDAEDLQAQLRLKDALERVPVEDSKHARLLEARLLEENETARLEVRVALSDPLASDVLLVVEEPAPHFFGRERLVESIKHDGGTEAHFTLPLLDASIAEKMRRSGVRLLLKNGETSLSAFIPVQ
ncbi:MAG: protein-disulfide reductase DsbD family protein [Hyphomicrobiales bacterium]|nr:protein-disulfide reductase DsbD family protein [Hyphomicrobiales bacterium]